jgi:hypothetical protein
VRRGAAAPGDTMGVVEIRGPIRKMSSTLSPRAAVEYALPVGGESLALNPFLGSRFGLRFGGEIRCIHCDRSIRKSFNQGYCYPCFTRLARCDRCVVKPELCHYHRGTCREPEWGELHCLTTHTVYLANSSGLKVGITRGSNPISRWIDQGASQGLAIRSVPSRLDSGRVEVSLAEYAADKTNWRAMLRGVPDPIDLESERDRLMDLHRERHPEETLPGTALPEARALRIEYPILEYPQKVVSHDLEKKPQLEGTLLGIKGQYLIFDRAVINLRKYAGYCLEIG